MSSPRASDSGEALAESDPPAGLAADEVALARRARQGDRVAFERLYRRFAPTVHGLLLAGAPRQEVDDLVQDVFVAALGSIERLDDPTRVAGWLATIARNVARDAHKRRRERGELDVDVQVEQASALDQRDEAERVLAHLRALPECYREPLVLRLVEDLPGAEIATRLGMTHGSVRVNLVRGMKLLRERLERGGSP